MASFLDGQQQTWLIELDGLLLGELREKGVDIIQDGLFLIETREDLLAKALLVICRDQITQRKLDDRTFARLLSGEVSAKAIEAVRGAAQVFFRPSRWSEIQSLCEAKRDSAKTFRDVLPLLTALDEMPPGMRDAALVALQAKIAEGMAGPSSSTLPSVSGQDATPSNAAGVSQAS